MQSSTMGALQQVCWPVARPPLHRPTKCARRVAWCVGMGAAMVCVVLETTVVVGWLTGRFDQVLGRIVAGLVKGELEGQRLVVHERQRRVALAADQDLAEVDGGAVKADARLRDQADQQEGHLQGWGWRGEGGGRGEGAGRWGEGEGRLGAGGGRGRVGRSPLHREAGG